MKVKYLIPLLFLVMACKVKRSDSESAMLLEIPDEEALESMVAFEEIPEYLVPTTQMSALTDFSDRRLIKHGALKFETENLDQTISLIKRETEKVGGYVAGETEFDFEARFNNTMSIRIPASHFDIFLATIAQGVDRFDRKDISTRDITEEYLDLETRIENKKKLEKRYLEILKKADSVKDILSVESETGKIREEIESMQGRLNFLENKSSFSTLEITCYEIIPTSGLKTTFISQLEAGLNNGVGIVKSLILGLVNIWPLTLLGVAGFFFFKQRIRTKQLIEPSE